jgi:hypothetical protein
MTTVVPASDDCSHSHWFDLKLSFAIKLSNRLVLLRVEVSEMKTKSKLPENSVAMALVEINRIERDRASFASAKRAVGEQLERQGRELGELRRCLLAERPRAWARRSREHARRRERLEHERRLHAAHAETEHRERLALYAAELEAKRVELAAIAAAPTIERPGRRVMEWGIPAAATVLVAFFAMLAIGEDDGGAHASASPAAVVSPVGEVEPSTAVEVQAEPELGPSAGIEPDPFAAAPEPAPEPAKPIKPVSKPKPPKKPPLTILDPNGDPLG